MNQGFFNSDSLSIGDKYKAQYLSAKPFPHIVLDDFLSNDVAELCLREFPLASDAAVQYQREQEHGKSEFSPEGLSPSLRSLFYSFNSAPFIGFLEGMTGIKGLIPDPYFVGAGFHRIGEGGWLNIHADFNHYALLNLERRINVLIYLNKDWREEFGGSLELWDTAMKACREKIVPEFNRCVIFNTSSTSFHGNPEPISHPEKTPRLSIALYYYTATWDGSRRGHTTRFKVRRGSNDAPDLKVRIEEVIADICPPILLRAYRKLARTIAEPIGNF